LHQVSAKAFASAVAVDPSQLPALLAAPRRKAVINLGRVWVLHRRRLLQALAALALAAAAAGLYEARDRLAAAGYDLYDLGERQLAHSPLGIAKISMTGQVMTKEAEILAAIDIKPETSMVNFDADAARAAIERLPAVASATVRKVYPNHVYVSITERGPVARGRVDGVTYVIADTGVRIGPDGERYPALPLVVGDEAGDDAIVMIHAMERFPALEKGLVALSRIADRRWDMIYDTGLRVKLPEVGVAQALTQLATLEKEFSLLERDVTQVDLRVAGVVAVKPTEEAAKQLDAIAKANVARNKGNFKEDADYSAPAR
jgi:cell division protein FtsQ